MTDEQKATLIAEVILREIVKQGEKGGNDAPYVGGIYPWAETTICVDGDLNALPIAEAVCAEIERLEGAGQGMTAPRPFTPEALAERWGCSDGTVRNMIAAGQLRAFRVGRMYRIPADAVLEVEECNTPSGDCAEASPSHGQSTASAGAFSLRHARERRPKPKPST